MNLNENDQYMQLPKMNENKKNEDDQYVVSHKRTTTF